MIRHLPIIFLAVLSLVTMCIPIQVLAGRITPTKTELGDGCTASGEFSTVGGGLANTASGFAATVAGGHSNTTADFYSTVTSGYKNAASGYCSTVGGGCQNTANGHSSTVGGGYFNSAGGDYSWAGGRSMQLTATAYHTFVWGYSDSGQSISTANAFLIFPTGTPGKVGIGTGKPYNLVDLGSTLGKKLAVYQGPDGNSFYGFGISSNTLEIYAGADEPDGPAMVVKKTTGNVGIGEANPSYKLHVLGSVAGTSWNNISSRDFKKDIQKVSDTAHPVMLAKLMGMDLTTYKYKEEYGGDGDVKLGFIAEDMPQEVLSKDGKGVDIYELITLTIGAMKAQQKEIREQRRKNDALKTKLEEVMIRLEALEK